MLHSFLSVLFPFLLLGREEEVAEASLGFLALPLVVFFESKLGKASRIKFQNLRLPVLCQMGNKDLCFIIMRLHNRTMCRKLS